MEAAHAHERDRAEADETTVAHPVVALAPEVRRITPDALLALQRTAGNRAVIQRLTSEEAYPKGKGSRYAKLDNLETDVADMRTTFALAEGATLGWSDAGFQLDVPVGTDAAPKPVTIVFESSKATEAYVPTSFTLDVKAAVATIKVHGAIEKAALKQALTRELNEIAFRVKASAGTADPAATDAAQAQRRVFAPGATPPDATLTANDSATLLELKAIWDSEPTKDSPRMIGVLAKAGLDAIHTLAWGDKKLVEMRKAGFADDDILLMQANRQASIFKHGNAGLQQKSVIFGAEQIGHLLMPEYRESTFAGAGLSGGHLESELIGFAARHERVHLVDAGTAGPYRKYHQYRWTGALPKPTTDVPVLGQPTPQGWEMAMDDGKPLPKSTFTDIQAFMRDALTAFQAWIAKPENKANAEKTNGDFGLSNDPAEANGQRFAGWMGYDSKQKKWTIKTIFPLV
jgi:hypothetical protein